MTASITGPVRPRRPLPSARRVLLSLGTAAFLGALSAPGHAETAASAIGGRVGLGKVLTTQDGGQIYGFDIDQNGSDGVLASAQPAAGDDSFLVSVETFNQNTGAISKSFQVQTGSVNSYSVNGIFAGDVALITRFVTPPGHTGAQRLYDVMNPVTAEAFTGTWTPPLKDVNVQMAAENQSTSTSVLLVIELDNQDKPDLIVSDIAANTFSNVIPLDPNVFGVCNSPYVGQYTAANEAVLALSPDCGAVHGEAPLNVLVNLSTGAMTQFNGYNNGPYHAGDVTGLAVDPNTGVAATVTELNAQVEFYDLANQQGIVAVQLPCTGDTSQLNSGSNIAVDPVHKLFLVTETYYCSSSPAGAIVVYDETGKLVETITGFSFSIGEPAPAINPGKRIGWAFGGPGGFSQLQQFFY
jgi:hypothetical protein